MKYYAYSAIDAAGEVVKGTVEADTFETASRDVAAKGLYVVSINETTSLFAGLSRVVKRFQISRAEIIEFCQNFSVMLKAGMPVLTCLEDMAASNTNAAFKSALLDMKQMIEHGSSVSAALEAQGSLFPDIVRTLVSVGEETGRFDASLLEASEHLQRVQNLADAIKKALMYPAFAISTTLGALIFWLAFVLPKLIGTMKNMGVKLPLLTRVLISVSNFFQAYWILMLLSLLLIPLAVYLMGKHPKARYYRDFSLTKIPIVKLIVFNKLMATFAEQFRLLVSAGIDIDRLFNLLIPAMGNEYFAVKLNKAKETVLQGNLISESIRQQQILTPLALRMISMGENSGTLETQLEFLAQYYTKKLNDATDSLGKVIEPVVMIVIGGLFAVIIMGLMLPIYDLVSKMGK